MHQILRHWHWSGFPEKDILTFSNNCRGLVAEMIRYIKGILIGKEEGKIVVLAGGVGYEILLPVLERK